MKDEDLEACRAALARPWQSERLHKRFRGYIKTYNPDKGFGFIECPELFAMYMRDTFVHRRQIGTCRAGNWVTFQCVPNRNNHPQAQDVQICPETADQTEAATPLASLSAPTPTSEEAPPAPPAVADPQQPPPDIEQPEAEEAATAQAAAPEGRPLKAGSAEWKRQFSKWAPGSEADNAAAAYRATRHAALRPLRVQTQTTLVDDNGTHDEHWLPAAGIPRPAGRPPSKQAQREQERQQATEEIKAAIGWLADDHRPGDPPPPPPPSPPPPLPPPYRGKGGDDRARGKGKGERKGETDYEEHNPTCTADHRGAGAWAAPAQTNQRPPVWQPPPLPLQDEDKEMCTRCVCYSHICGCPRQLARHAPAAANNASSPAPAPAHSGTPPDSGTGRGRGTGK